MTFEKWDLRKKRQNVIFENKNTHKMSAHEGVIPHIRNSLIQQSLNIR